MIALSIIIPCYNEAGNIPLIVARLRELFGEREDVEILLVDNGSSDGSGLVFSQQLAACDAARFRLVTVPVNQGYGYGILSGVAQAEGCTLAWTHADMQTDPADVLTAFDRYKDKIEANECIVKGKRRNRELVDTAFTFGMQAFVLLMLRVSLDDINAQPKIFSKKFFEQFIAASAPHDFSLDLFLLYQARVHGFEILTIPVTFAARLHGEAKGGGSWKTKLRLIRRTISFILSMKRQLIEETSS